MPAQSNKVIAINHKQIKKEQTEAAKELSEIIKEIAGAHYILKKYLKEALNAGSHSGLFGYDEFEIIGRLQSLTDRMRAEVHYLFEQFCCVADNSED